MFSFLPLPVGADIARPLFRAPILFFLFFEKEKNRRGVRGNSPHAILMMAGKQLLPYTKRILPDWGDAFYYHLFSTFSAKPKKSCTRRTVPSSSVAVPVNRPNT